MKNEVEIARYSEVSEAEVARGLLQSHEIPVLLQRDDAGGMEPPLHLGEGLRLVVPAEHAQRARQILADAQREAAEEAARRGDDED
jgi:hypothetical protein